jgi:hypothetical protein
VAASREAVVVASAIRQRQTRQSAHDPLGLVESHDAHGVFPWIHDGAVAGLIIPFRLNLVEGRPGSLSAQCPPRCSTLLLLPPRFNGAAQLVARRLRTDPVPLAQ